MKKLLDLIMQRRSVRKYLSKEVPSVEIERLLEAARWAPSGGNMQPWQFIIITDKKIIESVKMFSPGLLNLPPAIIGLCLDKTRQISPGHPDHLIDLGAAMQNILLMAHSMGLGSTVIGSFDREAVSELLSIPDRLELTLLVAVGYPGEEPCPTPRLPLEMLIEAKI